MAAAMDLSCRYLPKESLWPHVPEFVDRALVHITNVARALSDEWAEGGSAKPDVESMPVHGPCAHGFARLIHSMPYPLFQPRQIFASGRNSFDLLKRFTETRNLNLGNAINAHFIRTFQLDLIKTNYLINLYVKCGQLHLAHRVFDTMPQRNSVSCNALMTGYFHAGFPWEALAVFKSMDLGQLPGGPNEYMLTTVLACCADVRSLEEL